MRLVAAGRWWPLASLLLVGCGLAVEKARTCEECIDAGGAWVNYSTCRPDCSELNDDVCTELCQTCEPGVCHACLQEGACTEAGCTWLEDEDPVDACVQD